MIPLRNRLKLLNFFCARKAFSILHTYPNTHSDYKAASTPSSDYKVVPSINDANQTCFVFGTTAAVRKNVWDTAQWCHEFGGNMATYTDQTEYDAVRGGLLG